MPVTDTNYNALWALTDVVNNNATFNATVGYTDAVDNRGMGQGALFTIMTNIAAGIAGMNAKLDADGGVTDEDYSDSDLTALASTGNGITVNGMHQGDVVTWLRQLETNWNAILTKLDSDGGVADVNYNTLGAIDLDDTVRSEGTGLSQAIIIEVLDDYLTKFNATLTKLDADA